MNDEGATIVPPRTPVTPVPGISHHCIHFSILYYTIHPLLPCTAVQGPAIVSHIQDTLNNKKKIQNVSTLANIYIGLNASYTSTNRELEPTVAYM